jgi:hypothetical protein
VISNAETTVVQVDTTTYVEEPSPTITITSDSPASTPGAATSTYSDEAPTTTQPIDTEPSRPPWASEDVQSRCWRGDDRERVRGVLRLTPDQKITLCE